ncbi:hypothetical protein ASF06_11305 [Agreia sp. Leaf244]|uniref:hypothetical protein n=1 Tax=Agreia sp. Leaf244 TaxID=1736305 RepID=UPI0006F8A6AD|nr:hypothetical protein [Agreia sp. Leaf244]KQO08727.1 hypothetical protein ASF06_11305 [Agreia sp. Leaf244]
MTAAFDENALLMPVIDFKLVQADEGVRRAIQVKKRDEWAEFLPSVDAALLEKVEPHVRKAVASATAALNFLEDHELREDAHVAIHQASFVQRGLLGCPIVVRDDEYWTACPVNVSHIRMGTSVGMVAEFACSICGRMVEDCDHVMGEPYRQVAKHLDGHCSICEAPECEHVVGSSYLVVAQARTVNAVMHETSFVARPRYPQARITELTQDYGDEGDDPRFRALADRGALHCDVDLGPCDGLNEMAMDQFTS